MRKKYRSVLALLITLSTCLQHRTSTAHLTHAMAITTTTSRNLPSSIRPLAANLSDSTTGLFCSSSVSSSSPCDLATSEHLRLIVYRIGTSVLPLGVSLFQEDVLSHSMSSKVRTNIFIGRCTTYLRRQLAEQTSYSHPPCTDSGPTTDTHPVQASLTMSIPFRTSIDHFAC